MAHGYALPLSIVSGALSIVALLLLIPNPLANLPAVELARASYSRRGQTITHTFAGVLLLLLATPLYDAYRLYRASKKTDKEHFDPQISVNEVETVLSLYMCLTVLGTIFVLRKLGRVMGDKEHMAASEAALVKQAKGMQQQFAVMQVDADVSAEGASPAAGDSQAELYRQKAAEAEVRAADAVAAQRALEEKLATLEREFDKLSGEHSQLQKVQPVGIGSDGIVSLKEE
ncbi:hypothetical protein N2152v2_000315 [Parachlorella kessleri]